MNCCKEILQTFYGCDPMRIGRIVICSPIPAFYKEAISQKRIIYQAKGWWNLACVEAQDKPITIISHPEGNRIVDPVLSMSGLADHIYLLGLAGSIDPLLPIGSIAIAGQVFFENSTSISVCLPQVLYSQPNELLYAKVESVDGFLSETPSFLQSCKERLIQLLDMETYHFYRAAKRASFQSFTSLLYVSDQPLEKPFWESSVSDRSLSIAGRKMLSLIPEWNSSVENC